MTKPNNASGGEKEHMYETVKTLAEKKGKTIQEVEREAGLSKGSLAKWANHKPSIDKAARVAKVLGVEIGELL